MVLLGDSGYPLEPWVITPFRSTTENSNESFFNAQHSKGRSIIERTFGLLKARFRCLLAARELHYTPKKAVQLLNVCCALHNICLLYNVQLQNEDIPIPIYEDTPSTSSNDDLPTTSSSSNFTNIAKNIRNEIMNNMQRS